jgi:hypothetical protein
MLNAQTLRIFASTIVLTIATLVAIFVFSGPEALLVVLVLAVLEVSLSFDNAVVNAGVLRRMSPFWQRMFLTVGVLIAVFGMRLVFPIMLVSVTAHLSPGSVIDLALNHGEEYGAYLTDAHSTLAAYGGAFLLMIFLDFMFAERDIHWLSWIERPIARLRAVPGASIILALIALLLLAASTGPEEDGTVLTAGLAGMLTYLAVNGLAQVLDRHVPEAAQSGAGAALATGRAAFALFLYLEVLDASFSFDGVIGAFAISSDVVVIAAGLGIGALFVRSLTMYLVRRGTLDEYVFLEHGAHYALGTLAVLLGVSITRHVPEVVTGLVGVAFIGAAYASSVVRRRKARSGTAPPAVPAAISDREHAPV